MLRHEEVAAVRWRSYDPSLEPLGQLHIVAAYDSRAGVERGPKGDITRSVPVHPTLAKILAEWKLTHWPRIYGRGSTVRSSRLVHRLVHGQQCSGTTWGKQGDPKVN